MPNTCRICLRSGPNITKEIESYLQIIENIAQIQLILTNDLPSNVCDDCVSDLEAAQLLREMLLDCNTVIQAKVEEVYHEIECQEIIYEEYEETQKEDSVVPDSNIESQVDEIQDIEETHEIDDETHEIDDEIQEIKCTRAYTRVSNRFHDKQKYYQCFYCDKNFSHIEMHMKNEHPEFKHPSHVNVRCAECKKVYSNIYKLNSHLLQTHLPKNFVCDECGRAFGYKSELTYHISRKHSDVKKFTCDICKTKFKSKNDMNRHKLRHTGEKPHKCQFCEKAYANYSDWKTHHLSHTGEWKYFCVICKKGFYKPSALKIHQQRCFNKVKKI
uniref:CSON014016 protein n=1 Tax=Culicoides sonorensis TaxID=179676 RepID=A0A336MC67_CULSO